MSAAVDQILARRSRRMGRRPEAMSLLAALLLHTAAIAAVLFLPRLAPPPEPLEFVPVTILPAQALGVRRPAARPRSETPRPPEPEPAAEEPAPEPPAPEPEPERPEPRPTREDVPALLDPEKKPEKKPEKPAASDRDAKKPAAETPRKPSEPEKPKDPSPGGSGGTGTNPAGTAAQGDPEGQPGRRGSPTGSPTGTSAFGSEIASLDPDFTFGYYLDQLLAKIDANWVRPPLGGEVRAIISFRIERNGKISDLRVSESSGYTSFDLAAHRAVQNAAPFPPLPRAYRRDSLGVNLIVR